MITCKFEDGGEAKLRHVTVNALVIKDGKILLGKRGTYGGGKPMLEGGKWGLLGGFLNRDEDIHQAVIREIKEETGLEVGNLQLLHIKDNPDRPAENRQNVDVVFTAEVMKGEITDNEEVSELKWFSFDKLPPKEEIAFDHVDDLELYKAALDNKVKLPFFGKYIS